MKPLTHDIVLTHFDHHRLQSLLQLFRKRSGVNPWNLTALELELSRARMVAPGDVPSDVITMNSKVVLRDLATDEFSCKTLVFPDAYTGSEEHVPVLSPLGLALLGCRTGDVLEYRTPEGVQRLLIEDVEYQPESKGNFFM